MNTFLRIGGIVCYVLTVAALLIGMPVWINVIGLTLCAVLHLYGVPSNPQEEDEGEGKDGDEDLFSPDKLLRIREQYEKRISSIETEKNSRIEELEQELAEVKTQMEEDINAIRETAEREIDQAKNTADGTASILPTLP